ncbi:MBL fold metallo-hydrolase [Terasakiella pusilla]|uniref:MBL fold metallo-hydrolase n=1 Tax=Terasakiella pusilla TaxID=64973 RepID=UPI003AA9D3F5
MTTKITIKSSGSCSSYAKLAAKTQKLEKVHFPAHFGVIQQPEKTMLFDTGYAPRVDDIFQSFPYQLYKLLLPTLIEESGSVKAYLQSQGIGVEAVELILISHFHPDHIGGLKDFPTAQFLCAKEAWDFVKDRRGLRALSQGFLPQLIPNDFENRLSFIEDLPAGSPLGPFAQTRHLNWRGTTCTLVPLPGHIPGQYGLFVEETGERPVFFISDSLWDISALETLDLPNFIGMHVQHNNKDYIATIHKLHALKQARPEIRFIATHDRTLNHAR